MQAILDLADAETKNLWDTLFLGYTDPRGHPLLRQELSHLYSSLTEDQVLPFSGEEEGIYAAMRVLLEPGDHVVAIHPCYETLAKLPQSLGAETTFVSLSAADEWKLDLEAVKKAIRPTTKLLIANYPHNPTGRLLEKRLFQELIEIARTRGVYLFCDEVYRGLEIDENERLPSIADAYEKGVAFNVLTKSFGLGGLALGWLASQDPLFLKEALSYKFSTSLNNSAPNEILGLIALRAKERILERSRSLLKANLLVLDAFIGRHPNLLSWTRPQSGNVALLHLNLPISIEDFADELARKEKVLILPGTLFDLPDNHFRIGFGKKDMPEMLNRLESFLKTIVSNRFKGQEFDLLASKTIFSTPFQIVENGK